MSDYKKTVGIEIHCELKTTSKMFSSSKNDFKKDPNVNINEVDFAYPGTLPTINEGAVKQALKAAKILNCEINKTMYFDRKNYFYPDLPKGYQITQARTPIGINGYVMIDIDGTPKKIRIHDVHIEEDTAKTIHHEGHTLLDFNRCGVPLIEIVSEADMSSSIEAMKYVEKIRELLFYADISDCKIEEGSMRCDVNVSISKTEKLNTRAEIKNVGSISNVGLAIEQEAKRQEEIYENGGIVYEETRRFDEEKCETVLLRRKETGNDYRYFPDGDIPPLMITDEWIDNAVKEIPVLPDERRKIYLENDISEINAEKIIQNKKISDYLLRFQNINLKIASNLLLGEISAYLNKNFKTIEETKLTDEKFIDVVTKLDNGEISNKVFKEICIPLLEKDLTVDEIIKDLGIEVISDSSSLENLINSILDKNIESIKDYKEGKDRAVKYLMGQIMKESQGKADARLANSLLIELLNKR